MSLRVCMYVMCIKLDAVSKIEDATRNVIYCFIREYTCNEHIFLVPLKIFAIEFRTILKIKYRTVKSIAGFN